MNPYDASNNLYMGMPYGGQWPTNFGNHHGVITANIPDVMPTYGTTMPFMGQFPTNLGTNMAYNPFFPPDVPTPLPTTLPAIDFSGQYPTNMGTNMDVNFYTPTGWHDGHQGQFLETPQAAPLSRNVFQNPMTQSSLYPALIPANLATFKDNFLEVLEQQRKTIESQEALYGCKINRDWQHLINFALELHAYDLEVCDFIEKVLQSQLVFQVNPFFDANNPIGPLTEKKLELIFKICSREENYSSSVFAHNALLLLGEISNLCLSSDEGAEQHRNAFLFSNSLNFDHIDQYLKGIKSCLQVALVIPESANYHLSPFLRLSFNQFLGIACKLECEDLGVQLLQHTTNAGELIPSNFSLLINVAKIQKAIVNFAKKSKPFLNELEKHLSIFCQHLRFKIENYFLINDLIVLLPHHTLLANKLIEYYIGFDDDTDAEEEDVIDYILEDFSFIIDEATSRNDIAYIKDIGKSILKLSADCDSRQKKLTEIFLKILVEIPFVDLHEFVTSTGRPTRMLIASGAELYDPFKATGNRTTTPLNDMLNFFKIPHGEPTNVAISKLETVLEYEEERGDRTRCICIYTALQQKQSQIKMSNAFESVFYALEAYDDLPCKALPKELKEAIAVEVLQSCDVLSAIPRNMLLAKLQSWFDRAKEIRQEYESVRKMGQGKKE